MPHPPDLLDATEQIADLLERRGIHAIVIGAAAMAAHHYVRHTEDVDLGVNMLFVIFQKWPKCCR